MTEPLINSRQLKDGSWIVFIDPNGSNISVYETNGDGVGLPMKARGGRKKILINDEDRPKKGKFLMRGKLEVFKGGKA